MKFKTTPCLWFLPCWLLLCSPGWSANGTVNAVELNNDGVRALAKSNYGLAIQKFEDALQIDPHYGLAIDNLAVAYNNAGLALRKEPHRAMQQFHMANWLDPSNPITAQNLDGMIKLMGRDPNSPQDRLALGNQCAADHDFAGAICEYKAVLALQSNADARAKLAKIVVPDQWKNISKVSKAPDSQKTQKDVDFGPYMAELQKKIKSHWQIKNDTSKSSQVTFKVDSHGDLSALKLTKSSGSAKVDESGLQAVRDAAPFSPLPIGSPNQVDVQFSFDYNVFAKGDASAWKKKVASLQKTGGLELAKALVALGGCYDDAEDYKNAAQSYDQAIAIFESKSGTTYSGDLFDALNDAGTIYQTDLNDFPDSEKMFRKALNLIKRQANPDPEDLASVQQHLGEALSQQLKTSEAVPLLKTALDYRSKHRNTKEGKDSYTDVKQSLADAYWGDSQVDQAFPLYQEVLKETETQDGTQVTDVIRPLCDVADCLHAQDEDDKALPLYNKAIKLAKDLKFQDSNGIVADAKKTVAEIKNGGSGEQSDSSNETQTSTAAGSQPTASRPTRKSEVDSDTRAVAQQVDAWVYPLLGGSILILTLVAFLTRKKN